MLSEHAQHSVLPATLEESRVGLVQAQEANEDLINCSKRLECKIGHLKPVLAIQRLNLPRDSTTSPAGTNKESYKAVTPGPP